MTDPGGMMNLYSMHDRATKPGSRVQNSETERGIAAEEVRKIAKDGTVRTGTPGNHGGRRPASLVDKVQAGRAAMIVDFPETPDLPGEEMPPVKEYMKEQQKNGKELHAEEIFNDTWKWLKERGCEKLVSNQMVEQYAMAAARWIQCEQAISEFGFLAKHPTTKAATASPYVAMSRDYAKQMNAAWYQIFEVVRANSLTAFDGPTPQDDMMEILLRTRK